MTLRKKKKPTPLTTHIRSALRKISAFHHSPIKEALERAKTPAPAGLRVKHLYKCAECGGLFPLKQVAVDHIENVGTLQSFEDLPTFCYNLFCSVEGLQVLCDADHDIKTYMERYNVSKEEAVTRKNIIAYSKLPIAKQCEILYNASITPVKTKAGRLKQYEQFIRRESK